MNNVAILSARNFIRDGGKFGNYVATSYELQGDRIILSCICDGCGAQNKIPYSHVNVEARTPGSVRCINRERHAPVAKAAEPDWASMDQAQFKKYISTLQSDVFLKMCRTNPAFAARNEATPTTYIERNEAIARRAQMDAEARLAPVREWWKRLYRVCSGNAGIVPPVPARPMPVQSLQEMAALKPAQLEQIITDYGLRENDGMVRF